MCCKKVAITNKNSIYTRLEVPLTISVLIKIVREVEIYTDRQR